MAPVADGLTCGKAAPVVDVFLKLVKLYPRAPVTREDAVGAVAKLVALVEAVVPLFLAV